MPITSVIIKARPKETDSILPLLSTIPSVDVHDVRSGHFVITIEAESIQKERSVLNTLEDMPSVLSVSVVFTNREDCIGEEQ